MTQPTDGKKQTLTVAQRNGLVDAITELQRREQLSDATISKVLRCSRSVWSQIKRRIYGERETRWLLAGRQWLADRAARVETPATPYARTSIGELIMAVCHRAWKMPSIGKIITPSGCGKTLALQEFRRRRGDRALYLQVGEAFSSKQGLIFELAEKLGLKLRTRSTSSLLYREIRNLLADYYAGGVADPYCLLIDEATTLRPSALNVLRNLHDDPAVRCAVVLADTGRLDAELHSRRGIAGGYEQLYSRFGAVYVLPGDARISMADVRAVADSTISALGYAGPKLARETYDYLHQIAQRPRRLRNVAFRLQTAYDTVTAVGGAPTYGVAELDYVADLVGEKRDYPKVLPAFVRDVKRKTA